ncbi:MAG: type II secretion system F family protein [Thermoguttaceae bacterium]|jgi:general secretion pathway protein F/type IV pilus assembly protein PilC|nr:type II secretion system F family protein [Thermoguttaceae bacterium]
MPHYSYVARDASGNQVTGTIEAASQQEVLAAIAGRSLFPVEIGSRQAVQGVRRRVPASLLSTTLGQMSDLLQSGVPLLRSLEVLRRQTSHPGMREIISDLHRQVEDGASLAEAMQRHQRVLGQITVSMVQAGGEGGFLEESLSRVSAFIEAQEDLKSRTVGALAYPFVLAGIFAAVLVGILVFLVPRFESIFAIMRQRGDLPLLTEWLLGTSRFVWNWGLWLALPLAMAGSAAWKWLKTEQGETWSDLLKLRLPIVGPIFRNLAISRFCRVLGMLLSHGVPILRALQISSEAAGNRVLAAAVVAATKNISAGQTLAQPLSRCEHFPETIVEMIAVAEESNRLDRVLIDIADGLQRRTFRRLDLAVRLLEPAMLVLIASMVLLLVIALLLPMFRMSMAIG